MWPDHAERDRRNPRLLGSDGEYHSHDELLATADPGIAGELDRGVREAKYARCQDAIARLAGRLAAARPDVAVVVGDDQREPGQATRGEPTGQAEIVNGTRHHVGCDMNMQVIAATNEAASPVRRSGMIAHRARPGGEIHIPRCRADRGNARRGRVTRG